ncbi:hypothetical protein [Clostridium sp. UBA4395]|uniref:hypothetical protein n=1 Tax=Clostridium sp. UBA4395 TaxID=1946360 RepID=UPI003217FC7C
MNNNSFSLDLQKNEGSGINYTKPTQDSSGIGGGSGFITLPPMPTGNCPAPSTQSITKNSIFVKCGQF